MDGPAYPATLTVAQWERLAGDVAKARPTLVSDALAELKTLAAAIDYSVFDPEAVKTPAELPAARARADQEIVRRITPAMAQTRVVEAAASKCADGLKKDPASRAAVSAAGTIGKAAAEYRGQLHALAPAVRSALNERQKALEEQARKPPAGPPPPSPERLRVKARIIDRFRVVKNRPDIKVCYLVCVGNKSAAPWLAPMVSDSMRPTLKKVLAGDTGLKFFSGEVVWEEGCYTFVGPRMTKTLARKIEEGILALTGTRFRIKGHE